MKLRQQVGEQADCPPGGLRQGSFPGPAPFRDSPFSDPAKRGWAWIVFACFALELAMLLTGGGASFGKLHSSSRDPQQRAARARRRRLHALKELQLEPDIVALPELLKGLHDSDAVIRQTAVELMAPMRFGPEYGLADSLSVLQHDPSAEIRAAAVLAIKQQADDGRASRLLLLPSLADSSPSVRASVVLALSETRDSLVTKALLARLADPQESPDVRADVAGILGRGGARRAFGALRVQLGAPDEDLRLAAIRALPAFGESLALVPLLGALHEESLAIRLGAIQALGRLDRHGSVRALIGQLDDPDPEVLAAAVRTLGDRGDSLAARPLVEILLSRPTAEHPIRNPRRALINVNTVRKALVRIGAPAVPAVLNCAQSADPEQRRDGIWILGRIGDEPSVAALVDGLADWPCGPDAAQALKHLNWRPQNRTEEIHYLLALRQPEALFAQPDELRSVLMDDVSNGTIRALENAVFALLSAGNESTIPDLIAILNRRGTRTIAEAFINSGLDELETEGRNWARRHGYFVIGAENPGETRWGNWLVPGGTR